MIPIRIPLNKGQRKALKRDTQIPFTEQLIEFYKSGYDIDRVLSEAFQHGGDISNVLECLLLNEGKFELIGDTLYYVASEQRIPLNHSDVETTDGRIAYTNTVKALSNAK